MTYQFIVWILLVASMCLGQLSPDSSKFGNSLSGKHLVVSVAEFPLSAAIQRDAKGNIIKAEGVSPLIIDWLSLRYNFTYLILEINNSVIRGLPRRAGQSSFLESELLMAAIVGFPERLRYLELVHSWTYMPVAFLVPMPRTSQNNVDAVIKPFQLEVWIAFALAALSVVFTLSCSNWSLKSNPQQHWTLPCQGSQILPRFSSSMITEASMYVLGTLLNQGGYIPSSQIRIRLVIGAWCLTTFVLLNVYNGVLTSYLTAIRKARPIIDSIEDVAYDQSIKLVLEKGWACDTLFSTSEHGLYKAMGDKLNAYSKSRCNVTQQCIDMVKSLPRHVYINGVTNLKSVIQDEYRKTKQCKLSIAGTVPIGNHAVCWGMAKNSPYLEEFNRGTLCLRDAGLITQWEKWYSPDVQPCINDEYKTVNKSKPRVRLTLTNLAGPFAVLGIGSVISSLVFLSEIITFHWMKSRIERQELHNCGIIPVVKLALATY